MDQEIIKERGIAGAIGGVIALVLLLILNAVSGGFFVSLMGGVTASELERAIAGVAGKPGPQGEKGETGPAGPRGEQGARGGTGATGERGEQGQQGIAGPQGPAGTGPEIPAGAVVAFADAGTVCPDGWAPFEALQGRVIVGAGGDYPVGSTGGAATHSLSIGEMPPHTHVVKNNRAWETVGTVDGTTMHAFVVSPGKIATRSSGEGKPFSTMPPYLALTVCRKL